MNKKKFRDFESAREFVIALNLKGQKEWYEYCKSGNKPIDIPTNLVHIYKKLYYHSYNQKMKRTNNQDYQ